MAYKRYIKRGKKIYGPYIYHSRKEGNKVISDYRGKPKEKKSKNKFWLYGIIGLTLILLIFLSLNYIFPNLEKELEIKNSLTGLTSLETAIPNSNKTQIVLGKPVKWKEHFLINSINHPAIKIPEEAEKVKIKNLGTGNKILAFFEGLTITGRVTNNENNEIIFDKPGEYELNYETPAPYAIEEEIERGKRVKIVGPETIHYKNVLSFTNLDENLNIRDPSSVKIHWVENDEFIVPVSIQDRDSNGIYDYVEWITPSLSTQTFEIIVITDAEHLDSNRNFISDIYEEVRELDDIWSEEISDKEYVRVTFEVPLDNTRDITIYPRVISGSPKIEVYEVDGTEVIAEFTTLNPNEYNKMFLTNLQGSQDVFDLRVVGGGC